MRFFAVEITPKQDSADWKVDVGTLPALHESAKTGPHDADFFIAPETMPVEQAFEELRTAMLTRMHNQIAQLTASADALAALQRPQFEQLHWAA